MNETKIKMNETKIKILLLFVLGISGLIIYRDFIFGNSFFVFKDVAGDTQDQYIMQYASVIKHLQDGNFTFWDFTNGLGINQYYNLFEPFCIFLWMAGKYLGPARILYFLAPLQILKIMLSGFCFYVFISEFKFNSRACFLSSIAYGLSGYLLVWGQHYYFGTVMIYYPLMLLFCEKFIRKEKKRLGFPIIICLCTIYSVYFTYMSLIGVGFYLLFRLIMTENYSISKKIKEFFLGCGQILMGIGMGGFAFFPAVNILMNVTLRLDVNQNKTLTEWIKEGLTFYKPNYYRTVILKLFSSNLQNTETIAGHKYQGYTNYFEDPILFLSILVVFLDIQFLFLFWKSKNTISQKIVVYFIFALMAFTIVFPMGGTIFNGFTKPFHRYTFVFLPFLLLAMAWTWTYLEEGGKISYAALFLAACLLVYSIQKGREYLFLDSTIRNLGVLALTGTLTAIALLFLQFFTKKWIRNGLFVVLGVAMLVNMTSEGMTGYTYRFTLKKKDNAEEDWQKDWDNFEKNVSVSKDGELVAAIYSQPQNYFHELYNPNIQTLLAKLEADDEEFYRVEKNFPSATTCMDSLAQGYRGISTYNSVLNKYLIEFFQTCYPEIYIMNPHRYAYYPCVEKNDLAAFLGVRYLISRISLEVDPTKFEKMEEFGDMVLYRNKEEADMVKFYTQTISNEDLKTYYNEENGIAILKNLLAIEDGKTYSDETQVLEACDSVKEDDSVKAVLYNPKKEDHVSGKIQTDQEGYAMFMIPYEDGWELTLNGEKAEIIRGDLGFIACKVNPGDYDVELTFHVPKLKEGIIVSAACWLLFILGIIWEKKKYKNK